MKQIMVLFFIVMAFTVTAWADDTILDISLENNYKLNMVTTSHLNYPGGIKLYIPQAKGNTAKLDVAIYSYEIPFSFNDYTTGRVLYIRPGETIYQGNDVYFIKPENVIFKERVMYAFVVGMPNDSGDIEANTVYYATVPGH